MRKNLFKGKKITVMGLGLLGRGVGDIAFLAQQGARLIVTDLKTKKELAQSLKQLKKYKNIHYTLGKHELKDFEKRDFIVKAAGVPLDSPYIVHARKNKVPVYMSTALFVALSGIRVVGITGTRGKTTVTHMLHEILKTKYKKQKTKVFLGGNVQGVATLPFLATAKKGDIAVLELDSWQLQGFGESHMSPQISVFTTFMPDHLNYYKGDLKKYFGDKANIFKHQKKSDIFMAGQQLKKQKLVLPKNTIFVSEKDLPQDLELAIPGKHNRYNAALAWRAAHALGVDESIIRKSLESFGGVPGRLEKLKTYKGVDIYNDTTATTPHALVSALEAVGKNRNVLLIMGGSDKTIDLKVLKKPLKKYCKAVVLLPGTGTDRLLKEKIVTVGGMVSKSQTFKAAVHRAFKKAKKGEVILLSPGFASFGPPPGGFKNEYDRGDQFVSLVQELSRK